MFKSSLTNTELQALVNHLETQFPKASFIVAKKAFLVSKIVALAQSVLDSRAGRQRSVAEMLRWGAMATRERLKRPDPAQIVGWNAPCTSAGWNRIGADGVEAMEHPPP